MTVAALFNTPQTQQDLWSWSFVHATHHYDMVRVIYQNTGKILSSYVLDPFDPTQDTFDTWLYQHQAMHDQLEAILGPSVSNFDLTDVDWQDPESLLQWITYNANEHVQAGTILGLG